MAGQGPGQTLVEGGMLHVDHHRGVALASNLLGQQVRHCYSPRCLGGEREVLGVERNEGWMALGFSPVGRFLDLLLLGPAIFGRDAC